MEVQALAALLNDTLGFKVLPGHDFDCFWGIINPDHGQMIRQLAVVIQAGLLPKTCTPCQKTHFSCAIEEGFTGTPGLCLASFLGLGYEAVVLQGGLEILSFAPLWVPQSPVSHGHAPL